MKALDIDNHFRQIGTYVDWNNTTDGIKAGDPNTDVCGIAVCWKSTFPQLRKAWNLGCNFFLSHEATFLEGGNGSEMELARPEEEEKKQFLLDTGMVVYRCHDVWDLFPYYGVRDTWARKLGFEREPLASKAYTLIHEIEPVEVRSLAQRILDLTYPLGQRVVGIVGNPDKIISRVATNTGAGSDILWARSAGAEATIVSDDFFYICRIGSLAIDLDFSVLVVNHATSEEWGIMELAEHTSVAFPKFPVHFLPQGCQYTSVTK